MSCLSFFKKNIFSVYFLLFFIPTLATQTQQTQKTHFSSLQTQRKTKKMLLRSIKFLQKTPKKSFPLISFPVRNIQERFFSQSTTEPSYLIDWEGNEANLEDFQPAYLTDSKRMEIYYKHKNDPKEWSVYNISKRYGLSLSRTKAVLFLMKERENLMEKLGVKDLSDKWTNVYDDYLEDPETNTKEILAQKHSIPIEEVELILNNVGEHYWRKENLHAANEYNDECLDLLDAAG